MWRSLRKFLLTSLLFNLYSYFWINFASSTPLSDENLNSKESLRKVLEQVSGIYLDSAKAINLKLEKTILLTACNFGFVNHLHNFECFAKRLKMKFLVIAMDQAAHDYITHNTSMLSYHMVGGDIGEVTSTSTEFRSKQFNLITAKKKEIVHDILKLGYNVVFSDTDVAMVRDPIPHLLWGNVDYVHSLNNMCNLNEEWSFHKSKVEGNTGFYYIKASENAVKQWHEAYLATAKYPRLDDQAVFWKVIRTTKDPLNLPIGRCRHYNTEQDKAHISKSFSSKPLVSCMLDTCMFSSGMISNIYVPEFTYERLLTNLQATNSSIITLHANYLSGNKKKMNRMKEYGFWLSERRNNEWICKPYVPFEYMKN